MQNALAPPERLRGASERAKPGDVDLLGAPGRIEPRGVEQRGEADAVRGGEALQRLAQHLAALSERGLRRRREQPRLARVGRGARRAGGSLWMNPRLGAGGGRNRA